MRESNSIDRRANLGEENEQLNSDFAEELVAWVERVVDPEMPTEPLPIDPYAMGISEKSFEELSPKEKFDLGEVLFNSLGIDPKLDDDGGEIRTYQSVSSERSTVDTVKVFEAIQGTYLHELVDKHGESRFAVGPDQDI